MLDLGIVYADIHADINAGVAAEIWPDLCSVEALDSGGEWAAAFADVPCSIKFDRAPFPLTGKFVDAYTIKLPMQTTAGNSIIVNEGNRIRVAGRDDDDPALLFEVITHKRRTIVFRELLCRQIAVGEAGDGGGIGTLPAFNATCVVLELTATVDARFRPTNSYAPRTGDDLPCYFMAATASESEVAGRTLAEGRYTASLPTLHEDNAVVVAHGDRVTVRAQLTQIDDIVRPELTCEIVGILYADNLIKLDLAALGN